MYANVEYSSPPQKAEGACLVAPFYGGACAVKVVFPFCPMNLHLDCARSAVLFALRIHARSLHGKIWIMHGTACFVDL